jgi:hypothetical protein
MGEKKAKVIVQHSSVRMRELPVKQPGTYLGGIKKKAR